jgi:hypothetical protein
MDKVKHITSSKLELIRAVGTVIFIAIAFILMPTQKLPPEPIDSIVYKLIKQARTEIQLTCSKSIAKN